MKPMCHNCKRKMAFSLAALLGTGSIAFTPDDNDGDDKTQAVADMARILRVEIMRCVPEEQETEALHAEISQALIDLRNEIGGARFAAAAMEMIFMHEALYDGAQLAAALINEEAKQGYLAATAWMQRYGNRIGFEEDRAVTMTGSVPPAVASAIEQMAAKMPPGTQIHVETRQADKPVGTGPNGELH